MAHVDVLIDVNEVDNVLVCCNSPVEVNFTSRLGNITQDLHMEGKTVPMTVEK